jgi:AraC-like DNA-binding protein
MDVLSEVLRVVRLTGAVYFEVTAACPWVSKSPPTRLIKAAVMPEAEHVIPFHIVTQGRAWAMPEDRSLPASAVDPGDVVMFPLGESHILTSDPQMWDCPPNDLNVYFDAAESGAPFTLVTIGGDGDKTKIVCGYLGCDTRPFNPLVSALPRVLVIKGLMDTNPLMRELLAAALGEKDNRGEGARVVLAKLSELMFVQAMREHMKSLPPSAANWLSGLRDEHVGRALRLIHTSPAKDWSLEALARESGLSRSALAERFTRFAGEPPIQYLGRWRIQVAAGLIESGVSLGAVAERVGYGSEAAFQRAFKKHVGTAPGEWRKRARAN